MFNATEVDWDEVRESLTFRNQLLINGEWIAGSGEPIALVSPRNGEELVRVTSASASDVDLAVRASRTAFEAGVWSRMAPRERGQQLIAFAQLVHDHAAELALMVSLEMGKPVREAYQVELRAVVNCFRWYGEAIDKILDESPVTSPDTLALITREPAGVVGAVVPWNFPLTMTAWKLAPALAAGNSVVLKPDEHTSASALRLGELALQAGIPAGVLNVIPGYGRVAGQALGLHPDVDVITFTGSTGVGRKFLEYSAQSNGKRVWPELGGKTASLVLEDADFETAVTSTAHGCFYNQGQMCTAASRLLVPESRIDEALEIASRVAREQTPADPLDISAPMGSLVSLEHRDRVAGFVNRARAEGATVVEGDTDAHATLDGGAYFAPVVLQADRTSEIAQNEVFGPVLTVIGYTSLDEAIEIANETEYGLAASLWTTDLKHAHLVSRRIKAGIVWVNCFEEGDMTVPFGGVKSSGYGRDKSLHAIEKFTDLKTTWIDLS